MDSPGPLDIFRVMFVHPGGNPGIGQITGKLTGNGFICFCVKDVDGIRG